VQVAQSPSHRPQNALYCKGDGERVKLSFYHINQTHYFLFIMLNRQIVIGMLRQGKTSNQVLDILDVIVNEMRENICNSQGIADCPENEDEISAMMILN
jgi:hypothetical protein